MLRKRSLTILWVCLLSFLTVVNIPHATAAPLLVVHVSGYHLTAGYENEISIYIVNVSEEPAYDAKASLTVPSTVSGIAIVKESYRAFNEISSGETESMYPVLYVAFSCPPGAYSLEFTLEFYDGAGNHYEEEIQIGVEVESVSIINFRLLNVQPSDLTVEPGEIVTIEADLLLIGTEAVEFVQIEIVENHPFLSIPESYEYIGRVDPDSPVPFSIQFMVDPNAAPGSYTLQVRVSYWDKYNQERHAILELPVQVLEHVEKEAEKVSFTLWDIIKILLGIKP